MFTPILATKLYIPQPQPKVVLRPRLIERLNEGLQHKLTLISAPAGFGKTTLTSGWVAGGERCEPKSRVAWLSLDEGDSDPNRFLTYLVAALRTVAADIGDGVLGMLQSTQPPPTESILTALLNEIATIPEHIVLVLDDYHVIDTKTVDATTSVDDTLTYLLEHLPPRMCLVITTREDPHLPLARLRACGQLTELRAADLRFTPNETAEFLNQVMGLNLSAEDITALETRTEGWIAGLQLAAISMRGHHDTTSFIKSFTGSHHFVLDYLVEEVLRQQPESVQTFLLHTSVLDRLCGSLCDAVLLTPPATGQETLEYLERTNLFIVPLDNERRWYRYHQLFADLLRQRLIQRLASSKGDEGTSVAELHIRASQWYEDNGLELEAFQHAADANDIERAERLIEGKGMPLHYRGAMAPVLHWLESLPSAILDARPSLWVTFASATMISGKPARVEKKLQAAEAALAAQTSLAVSAWQGRVPDDKIRDLEGQIAALRALVAATENQVETMLAQSRRALELLHSDNLPARTSTAFTLGLAYQLQGDRDAASRAYNEVISIGQASGNLMFTAAAASSLGQIQEAENKLHLAVETYQRLVQLVGDPAHMAAGEAHRGLARIFYEWNDLDAAEKHVQQGAQAVRQIECDIPVACDVLLAWLKLARGDVDGADTLLAAANKSAQKNNFIFLVPEIAATQVLVLLRQGNLAEAAHLAQAHDLSICQARVHLAQGNPSAALVVLESFRQKAEGNDCPAERFRVMVLQAVALQAHGEKDRAFQMLREALVQVEPEGFIRTFVDEGEPMRLLIADFKLWIEKQSSGQDFKLLSYIDKLLVAFTGGMDMPQSEARGLSRSISDQKTNLIEPLSPRELEVLQLIALGLSNREISERLFLALSTVKGHSRIIFDKLQVQRRTEAVARARELGLL